MSRNVFEEYGRAWEQALTFAYAYSKGYQDAVDEMTGKGLYDHDSDSEMEKWDRFFEDRRKEAGCPGTGTTRSPE